MNTQELLEKSAAGTRLSFEEGLNLLTEAPLLDLGWAATEARRRFHADSESITFVIDYYEDLLCTIRSDYPQLTLHALSPSEIDHITRVSNLTLSQTIERLIAAGLSSIPGGGAEILTDRVKEKISPLKMPAARWL